MQQLDIFNDSRDRVLVNAVAEAVGLSDIARAQSALQALRDEFPVDRHVQPATLLIDALSAEHRVAAQPLADHAAALAARQALEGDVGQAAHALLGSTEAAPWLATRWRALGRRAAALAFEAFDAGPDAATAGAWWPAWLLVEQPLMAAPMDTAQTAGQAAPERCFKLLQSLLRLERQGRHRDIVALRRELRGLHPALLTAYMATR